MIDLPTALVLVAIALLSYLWFQNRGLPPGPCGLPLLGYMPFMGHKPMEEALDDLRKKYGNVMSLRLGSLLVVVLGEYEAIKEAYVKQGEIFSGRDKYLLRASEDDSGLVIRDGEMWRAHRRFALSTLRDFGFGKMSMEPRVLDEIHYFLEELANRRGNPSDLKSLLEKSTSNVICTLAFGKRFDYDDKTMAKMFQMKKDGYDLFVGHEFRPFLPWLKYVPFSNTITKSTELAEHMHKLYGFLNGLVEEHKLEYQEGSRKDFIDAYLTEQKEQMDKNGDVGYFSDDELPGNLEALFSAGSDTTSSSICLALQYLIKYPETQVKVQKEIDEVIGMERTPSLTDKSQMVYTEALLLEVQRIGSILPLNLPHANTEETQLFGYRIPKRTIITTNLWAVHRDPNLWKNPERFCPERFITSEGKIHRPEYLIPFGIGKRSCLGESLARMELFLYFTSMLQNFSFQTPTNTDLAEEFESAVLRCPKPFKVCAVERNENYSKSI